jgi:hypothetical protein
MSEAKTLLEYGPDLLEEMERIKAEENDARAEVAKIDSAIFAAELAESNRRAELVRPDRSRVLAEAALAGEAAPPEPEDPPGPPVAELQSTIRGLRAMRDEPEKRIEVARAALAGRCREAFKVAAQRAAVDYLDLADRLRKVHAEIAAAQTMAGSDMTAWVVGESWWKIAVPSSGQLRALDGKVNPHDHRGLLFGGHEDTYLAAQAAFDAARSEVMRLLGGRWPLDKTF